WRFGLFMDEQLEKIKIMILKKYLKNTDEKFLKEVDINHLRGFFQLFIDDIEYQGIIENDLENFFILFKILEVQIDRFLDEELLQHINNRYPKLEDIIVDIYYTWECFRHSTQFLFKIKEDFDADWEQFKEEYRNFLKEKDEFDATKTFLRQKDKLINNLCKWEQDIICVLDREISTTPLPEGESYDLSNKDKNILIDSIYNRLKGNDNISFDKI
ncbi:MAG: hypothetical protein ACOCQ4_02275, partial [bacterium]